MNPKKLVLAEAELCVLDVYEREIGQHVRGVSCASHSIPHPEVVILEIRKEARNRCNLFMRGILGDKQALTIILTSYVNQGLRLWSAEAAIFHPSRLARLKSDLQEATRSDSAPRAARSLVGESGAKCVLSPEQKPYRLETTLQPGKSGTKLEAETVL